MRDPRLREAWALSCADERRAETERLLARVTTADRTKIDSLLAEWWTDVLAQDSPGGQWEAAQVESLRAKCSSLPAGSQKIGLTAPDTLARNATDEDCGIGALLLGESAAAVVRSGSSAVALDRAVKFLSECWKATEVLIERLAQAPAWPGALETLAPATPELAGLLGRHFGRTPGNDVLLDAERTARERGLLTYFWGRPIYTVCLNHSTLARLALLAARDWQSLARQAEALPLRELREDLWRHLHLHEDRDAILSLLRAAPPVFDASKWTGSTSALAGLVAAIEHGDQLYAQLTRAYPPAPDAEATLRTLVEQEIPDWLKQVAEAVIARPDGRLLLLLFGSSLIREALRPPWNGQRPWSSARHALCAIHRVLTPKPSVAELQQVASAGGVSSNRTTIDHATYLVTSAAFDACASDVWAWYRNLLLQSDEDLCCQAQNWRRSLCYEALAKRLDQLADPFEEWRAVWKALFVMDRERARFDTLDQDALLPSIHLLRVGAELLRRAPSRCGSQQFFEEMLAHTHRLLANDTRFISPLQPDLAVDGIDVAPRVLGSDWPRALEPHRPLLSNAKHRLYVAALLLEGGASFGDVEAAVEVAGRRLTDSIAELKQSAGMDLNVHRFCEIVTAAAKEVGEPRPTGR
ncbi:MAG: hypothetical protein MUF34_10505 [Polyangiaceae bacterium]|nr:hypothetical protein [Polyangiaceae bacterium]